MIEKNSFQFTDKNIELKTIVIFPNLGFMYQQCKNPKFGDAWNCDK